MEHLYEEYVKAYKAMGVVEDKLVQELQKYVKWGEVEVGFTRGIAARFIPIVKIRFDIYELPLKEFISYIKEHGK